MEDKKNEYEKFKMQFEAEKKQKESKEAGRALLIAFFVLACLTYFVLYAPHRDEIRRIENAYEEIQHDINEENYEIALNKLDQLDYHAGWGGKEVELWTTRKKELKEVLNNEIKNHQIQVPLSSFGSKGKQYDIVQSLFEDAGFTDVKSFELDEKPGLFHKKGEVKTITVNGESLFFSTETFYPDSPVLIFYYSNQ